jgi:glyceraldehyde 3-phosphate dehydrogenase
MAKKKIAINGFGRIGRTCLRVLLTDENSIKNFDVVAINIGPAQSENIDLLFKYDSVMGTYPKPVSFENGELKVDGFAIKVLTEKDPSALPWQLLGVDVVIESSGAFRTKEKAGLHLKAGAKKVLITAPAKDEDVTIIPGVNDNLYDKEKHNIISLGSCTTNCFAPMVKVIKENFGLKHGLMTTIHAYTNDQVLLDVVHKDPRRARAAALNMIPTKTGAGDVIIKLFPELEGKIKATAIRVPTPVVSLVDFSFETEKEITAEQLNEVFKKSSETYLKNIMHFINLPLVSSDFEQSSYSCIIDSLLTQVTGNLGKVFGWYDNEYGYCSRVKDFLLHI